MIKCGKTDSVQVTTDRLKTVFSFFFRLADVETVLF